MCGLVGVISSSLSPWECDIFKQLMVVSSFRGQDSTGFAHSNHNINNKITSNIKISYIKNVELPQPFIYSEQVAKALVSAHALQGHTRLATIGDISIKNCHPFMFERVMGSHNGTIRGKFEGSGDFSTDSEALYALINAHGIEEALNIIKYASPAYALSWMDLENDTFHLICNHERPLNIAIVGKETLWYASEKAMLDFVLNRHNLHITQQYQLKPHVLVSIDLNRSISNHASHRKLEIEKYVQSAHSSNGYWGSGFSQNWNKPNKTKKQQKRSKKIVKNPYHQERSEHYYERIFASKKGMPAEIIKPSVKAQEIKDQIASLEKKGGNINNLPAVVTGNCDASKKMHDTVSGRPLLDKYTIATTMGKTKNDNNAVMWYRGPHGLGFLRSELAEMLDKGCSICAQIPVIPKTGGIKWYTKNTFICEDCKNDEHIMAMIDIDAENQLKNISGN